MSNQGFVGDWVPQAGGMKPAAGNEGLNVKVGAKRVQAWQAPGRDYLWLATMRFAR